MIDLCECSSPILGQADVQGLGGSLPFFWWGGVSCASLSSPSKGRTSNKLCGIRTGDRRTILASGSLFRCLFQVPEKVEGLGPKQRRARTRSRPNAGAALSGGWEALANLTWCNMHASKVLYKVYNVVRQVLLQVCEYQGPFKTKPRLAPSPEF